MAGRAIFHSVYLFHSSRGVLSGRQGVKWIGEAGRGEERRKRFFLRWYRYRHKQGKRRYLRSSIRHWRLRAWLCLYLCWRQIGQCRDVSFPTDKGWFLPANLGEFSGPQLSGLRSWVFFSSVFCFLSIAIIFIDVVTLLHYHYLFILY